MKFALLSAIIASTLSVANAAPVDNDLGQLSAICRQSLLSIVADNEPCLPLSQIWSQATSIDWENYDPSNADQFSPLLNAMCTAPRCNKAVTDTLVSKIQTGCSQKPAQKVVKVIEFLLENYEPLIALECTRNSQQEYCLLVEGKDLQDHMDEDISDVPDDRLCTECVQNWVKVYDQYAESYADLFSNLTDVQQVKQRCGY
ncbi:hypothetical protein K493DRAFT_299537 [Basidiobolus meristosporus CBS 931.73]|uniref:Saposin B-type domain-containing protein n=1 Tax=Basidiobolus meristosporus CBS 931.73 TaxID=1314790 RepID=A0A1Y1YM53_9FUNG|nr:hypothetical protein K493DRAFT_299537 [Basidiobolus meristosporus CBS 931.73]|eukprot:ORX99087.1 hypothetical protein K493DRAFT_299537 [Basidiobolus meristosporus CBS 931.73]